MSAAAQMGKMPLAKSRSLKTLSKTVYDKDLCAHKRRRRIDVSKAAGATIYTENTKNILNVRGFKKQAQKDEADVKLNHGR